MMTHKDHQRIAEAWERVLDACEMKRLERNKMYICPGQESISVAFIEVQVAMDFMEITELSDAEVQIKLRRRLIRHVREMLAQVEEPI